MCVGRLGDSTRGEKKAPRSRHSFTKIIFRRGAAQAMYVCVRSYTFVFMWVCAAAYLLSAGSRLLCTPLCSSDKTLFHSPSTMTYQSLNHNPDCNSLLNQNLHTVDEIAPLFSPPHPEDPPSHASPKFMHY